jgi:hypothetical protein
MDHDQRILVTVILHHDQTKTLDEIMANLKKTGFYRDFPPEGNGGGVLGCGDVLWVYHPTQGRTAGPSPSEPVYGAESMGYIPLRGISLL